jgi:predicted ester cyclase
MLSTIKDAVRRQWFDELWDQWSLSAANELFTAGYQLHLAGVSTPLNRVAMPDLVKMFHLAFPDLRHTVKDLIAAGNRVAACWTVNGTHCGELYGIAATGRHVRLSGTTVHQMSGSKIAETWLAFDFPDLLQQLGADTAAG